MKMKQSELDVWTDALESGKYPQSKGRLQRKDTECTSYCCLGVLEEVMGTSEDQLELRVWLTPGTAKAFNTDIVGPDIIFGELIKLNLQDGIPWTITDISHEQPVGVSALNDNGLSFRDIATILKHIVKIVPE